MILETNSKFRSVIKILDFINPYVVTVSIIGLILEFTFMGRGFLLTFNAFIDVFFVFDFLIRLFGYKDRKKYFFDGYGWVDLLAAVPGFALLFEHVPGLFKIFKILRIGRFFKIVRILRFLRIFNFLKKMKEDSPYVQERIMKIGVVIVLTLVVCIGLVDLFMDRTYASQKRLVIENLQKNNISAARALELTFPDGIICYREGKQYYSKDNTSIQANECDSHDSKFSKLYPHLLEVHFDQGESFVLLEDKDYLNGKNNVMLSMIVGLISLISIVIFYIGFILAKDIKLVNLVVDSIDADDYMLLLNEGQNYMEEDGEFHHHTGDDEIHVLFKMVNKLIIEKNLDSGMLGGGGEMDLGMSFKDLPSDGSMDMAGGLDSYGSEMGMPAGGAGGADLGDIREIIRQENDMLKEEISAIVAGTSGGSGFNSDPLGLDSSIAEVGDSSGVDFNLSDIKESIRGLNEELKEDILYEIVAKLEESQKQVAINSIKLTSKGIVNYLNKNIQK
ncbi:MAG: ion transporter [Spirochaetota bacterium]